MKKAIVFCLIVFFLLGALFVLFFSRTTIKKVSVKTYDYKESPFYKEVLQKNDSIIYLNIWASYSPYSVQRYQELLNDKNKIIYNLSLDDDSVAIKKHIEKFGLKNDITIENYNYRKEILKFVYHNWRFSFGDFIEFSDYKTLMTFVFDKQTIKKEF